MSAAPTCSLYQVGQTPRRLEDLDAISDHLQQPDAFVWLEGVLTGAADQSESKRPPAASRK